jgi:hypothetical protein
MKMPEMFRPPAVVGPRLRRRANAPIIKREGFITRELTMPEKNWPTFDQLAKGRFVSERRARVGCDCTICQRQRERDDQAPSNVTPILCGFFRRQAT